MRFGGGWSVLSFELNGVGVVHVDESDNVTRDDGEPSLAHVVAAARYLARLVRSGTHEIVDGVIREKP